MLFKLSYLNSSFLLTLGYLNPALNNPAQSKICGETFLVSGLCREHQNYRFYARNWPMRVKWAPFCNFRWPFFKKVGPPKGIWTYWYRLFHEKRSVYRHFTAILEHSEQLKKPGLKLLQNPRCFVGWKNELLKVQGKFIERPSNQCCCHWFFQILYLKKIALILGSIFCLPFDAAT